MEITLPVRDAALAPYACHEAASRGRRYPEPPPAGHRGEYQRDRDRIVHSTAFRRLVYKTQVFVNHEGDLYRTRLTHSLEVAQIARSICGALGINEALCEAICLAHDLGHTAFGHAGQDALNECMRAYGGFEHNLQSLRIVDELEERYAEFPGLNLTFECREGILKHCSPAEAARLGELGQPAKELDGETVDGGNNVVVVVCPEFEQQLVAVAQVQQSAGAGGKLTQLGFPAFHPFVNRGAGDLVVQDGPVTGDGHTAKTAG